MMRMLLIVNVLVRYWSQQSLGLVLRGVYFDLFWGLFGLGG